ncbi:histidine phosphatase family protein [Paenibacillus hamazuiensis]|uniref:histidine phosphatase family protein n=1 Tax=Paenibacillus hamazuiensis TaxID=2936508 RepID=UPI00200C244A|nr:histidine phosphatase family protein [Paenibacillus hamazuiensis]
MAQKTIVYMVRHADSPFSLENERYRGLSEQGLKDAEIVAGRLASEKIDHIFSSPYTRAVQTVDPLAKRLQLDILQIESFRETFWAGPDVHIAEFAKTVEMYFADPHFSLPGGESIKEAQYRAMAALKHILAVYGGKRVVIGLHGNILTFILNYFDGKYGIDFWKKLSRPDIYKLSFDNMELKRVTRIWKPPARNEIAKT